MLKQKLNGIVVPLGALYTKDNPVIGEFSDLKPFADFCSAAGISIIQLLPVNDTGTQSSPYSGLSAFALHPIYIRISEIPGFEELYKTEKFKKKYNSFIKDNPYTNRYKYDEILNKKIELLKLIYDETETGKTGKADEVLSKWIKGNQWVKTYSVYKNLKWKYMQASWKTWHTTDQNLTDVEILDLWDQKAFKKEHLFYTWLQFIANQQFSEATAYVKQKKILLKGDMPILMNEDSCDAWAFPQYFNQDLRAGSPSDGENPTGQNWGFPTYNWKNLKTDDYCWWKDRLKSASKYYDAYRLDHILGFYRIWAIPSSDVNALNGHTEPYAFIKKDELYELAFDDDRIRWLSQPHIPTGAIEDITWNHDVAHKILAIFCKRIGEEELWLFDPAIKGSKVIADADLTELCNEENIPRIKETLINYWSNRTLIEIAKNKYVPMWTYSHSTSWQTLSIQEKSSLGELFTAINNKNEKLWKKQADEIFKALTGSVKMIPCGEDLGINIQCVPEVMNKYDILGLRVIRWSRQWDEPNQPYIPFSDYTPLSVTTSSVHDSSTIRQWWNDEKDSVAAFIKANLEYFGIKIENTEDSIIELGVNTISSGEFTPAIAEAIMKAGASSASRWNISPLQDYLYMNKDYWLENAAEERINVPGTVTNFNWTYRLPVSLEDLSSDKELIEKIKKISRRS